VIVTRPEPSPGPDQRHGFWLAFNRGGRNATMRCLLAILEHFQAKWIPVRVKKMRQPKPGSDSIRTRKVIIARLSAASGQIFAIPTGQKRRLPRKRPIALQAHRATASQSPFF
jgi:hypothetical protein